jgi:hypothetical protein
MSTGFDPGTVVAFNPESFDPQYWSALSEEQKFKYFGRMGYGSESPVYFVFLCEIKQAPGHCVLVPMKGGNPITMVHTCNLKEAAFEEVQ